MMGQMRGTGIDSNRFMWIFLGIVAYIIIAIVQLNLYDQQMINADSFRLLFTDRCQVGDDIRFTRLYPEHPQEGGEPGSTAPLIVAETNCTSAHLVTLVQTVTTGLMGLTPVQGAVFEATTQYTIIEEHGERVGVFTTGATGSLVGGGTETAATNASFFDATDIHWDQPLKITERFNGLLLIIVGVLPLIATMHFLSVGAANMLSMEGTTATAMISLVFQSVITFLVIIVVIQFSPTILIMMNESYLLTESNRLSIFEDVWGRMTQILWVTIPLLFSLTLVGLFAFTGVQAYQRARPNIERGRQVISNVVGSARRGRGRRGTRRSLA